MFSESARLSECLSWLEPLPLFVCACVWENVSRCDTIPDLSRDFVLPQEPRAQKRAPGDATSPSPTGNVFQPDTFSYLPPPPPRPQLPLPAQCRVSSLRVSRLQHFILSLLILRCPDNGFMTTGGTPDSGGPMPLPSPGLPDAWAMDPLLSWSSPSLGGENGLRRRSLRQQQCASTETVPLLMRRDYK